MNNALLKLYVQFKTLAMCEDGQDLVEYALVVGLISVAAVAGLTSAGTAVSNIISTITVKLNAA
jgi:pilus assembly protein Flp/PilA